jgi:hypothetical protein
MRIVYQSYPQAVAALGVLRDMPTATVAAMFAATVESHDPFFIDARALTMNRGRCGLSAPDLV